MIRLVGDYPTITRSSAKILRYPPLSAQKIKNTGSIGLPVFYISV